MFKTIVILTTVFSSSAFAQINSKDFVDCFEKAVNDVIVETKENGGDTTRICDALSSKTKDIYIEKFSRIVGGEVAYYTATTMGKEVLNDLYSFMINDMDCYKDKVKHNSIITAFINSRSYHRNLNLVESALNKMIGVELWEGFFNSNAYKTLNEFDLSYCEQ